MARRRYSILLITVPDRKSADRIARDLVRGRLAACVNAVAGVRSCFRWEGKVTTSPELLLIVKTRTSLVGEASRRVKLLHPYTVPEIIALAVAQGHRPYLDWIAASTLSGAAKRGRAQSASN